MREAWKKPDVKTQRDRMTEWRATEAVVKLDKPLRIDRARTLGYKDKKGFVMVRVKLARGGRKNTKINKGRRSKRQSVKKILKMNYQWVAEQRAVKKYPNLEVLNSYKIGRDGIFYFYEVILVDPSKPEISKSKDMKWITNPANKKRVARGLTSAAKKSRGLRSKSHQLKVRPSLRARNRQGK